MISVRLLGERIDVANICTDVVVHFLEETVEKKNNNEHNAPESPN
jgi:hypothetical protein